MSRIRHRQQKPLIDFKSKELRDMISERSNRRAVDIARNRLAVIGLVFMFAFCAVSLRLADLMILDQAHLNRTTFGQAATQEKLRGDILDRNGEILATSLKSASVYADPKFIQNPTEATIKLKTIFPALNKVDLYQQLSSDRRFIWIKRHVTPREQYEVNKLGIPGVDFLYEQKRVYPHGNLTSHLIGYTDVDNKGIAGLEQTYNDRLENGEDIEVAVDVRVQKILHDELNKAIEKHSAIGGLGIIMQIDGNQIIGSASLPDFDPEHLNVANQEALFNRSTMGVYEMGSTFKLLTAAMALEKKKASFNNHYNTKDTIRLAGGYRVRDFRSYGDILSFPEVIMYSSNIGAARIIQDVGVETQQDFFEKIGLLTPLQVEVPERGAPLLPYAWNDVTMNTMSFGYSLAITPMQLVNAIGALVNDGLYRPASFMKNEKDRVYDLEPEKVISKATSKKVRQLMYLTVEQGTGSKAANTGYFIGGKTGTAQKNTAEGYGENTLRSSFVSAFPIHDPQYVMFVMLDEPQGIKETYGFATGGWTAAPVVRKVVERMAPVLSIQPFHLKSNDVKTALNIKEVEKGLTLVSAKAE